MLDSDGLKHEELKFVALTGITPAEFQRLLPAFTRAYARAFPSTTTQAGKPRQRRPGAGRKAVLLRPEDKLLFILVHMKQNLTQDVQGHLFGMIQSDANKWLQLLRPVLAEALQRLDVLPARLAAMFEQAETPTTEVPPFFIMMVPNGRSNDQ